MKKFKTILTLLIILLLSCNNYQKESKELYIEAKEDFKHKDFGNALNKVDKAIKLDSLNFELLILKSKIKDETKFNEEAIQILKTLLNKNYKPDTINFLIAYNYCQIGDYYTFQKEDSVQRQIAYNSALTYFDNAIKINSQFIDAYKHKQFALINMKRYNEAIITIFNALIFSSKNMSLIYARGISKYKLGDKKGALIDLNTAIMSKQLDSIDLNIVYRYRGNLYMEIGNLENAILDFTKAIEYNPKDNLAFAARGVAYSKNGAKENACADFRKAGDLGLVTIYKTIRDSCNK